jgi:molybdopterin-guanine dinucleotide biosynthesis protein A
MTADYLQSLIDECSTLRGIVPLRDDSYEPLSAVYPRPCRNSAEARLLSGQFNLQSFVRESVVAGLLAEVGIGPSEQHCFSNLNWPADLHS